MAKDVFVAPGGNLFVQFGALRLRGEEQEAFFNKCLLLFGGELLLCRDSLGAYVNDAALFGERPPKDFPFLWTCEG